LTYGGDAQNGSAHTVPTENERVRKMTATAVSTRFTQYPDDLDYG
jgi:hypothetical protein